MKSFFIFSSLFLFIPFIIGLTKFRKLDRSLRLIFYLITFGCISNLLMIYYGLVFRKNVWLGHIYTIVEFLLISMFFYRSFDRDTFKKIIFGFMVFFTIITTINKIYLESFNQIDNYTLTISAILLLISSSMFLVDYLTKNLIINVKDYRFILTVGFMIYFGGNLFIFALSNEIEGIWIVHNFISTILISIYTLTFIWQN